MTTLISIYSLWSSSPNMDSIMRYARSAGFTITRVDGASLSISETLTATQQSAIKDLFRGTAYLEFDTT